MPGYLIENSQTLKNRLGITDAQKLESRETELVAGRQIDMPEYYGSFDLRHLQGAGLSGNVLQRWPLRLPTQIHAPASAQGWPAPASAQGWPAQANTNRQVPAGQDCVLPAKPGLPSLHEGRPPAGPGTDDARERPWMEAHGNLPPYMPSDAKIPKASM